LASTTNYEELRPRDGTRRTFDLDRMRNLLAALAHPERHPQVVHIAGSKGKGTVARLIALGMQRAGRSPIGLYTSPHLVDLSERIMIDGVPIHEAAFATAAERVRPHLAAARGTPAAPTFFELMTAVAHCAFQDAGCKVVVLETGLGGRLDATNVCEPDVTVITSIELEHTRLLGDTLTLIAGEKAGILKAGVPAITTAMDEALDAIRTRARSIGAPLEAIGDDVQLTRVTAGPGPQLRLTVVHAGHSTPVSVALPGVHHAGGVAAAVRALQLLAPGIDAAAALEDARLPGLLEPVATAPLVLIDGAHTARSAEATRNALEACYPGREHVLLLCLLQEKDVAGIIRPLCRGAQHVVVAPVQSPRTMSTDELTDAVLACSDAPVSTAPDAPAGLEQARRLAGPEGLVLATGSLYLAGEVKTAAALLRPTSAR
jgi:dihydrofolate synthase/folylpolyglutamate synthase